MYVVTGGVPAVVTAEPTKAFPLPIVARFCSADCTLAALAPTGIAGVVFALNVSVNV